MRLILASGRPRMPGSFSSLGSRLGPTNSTSGRRRFSDQSGQPRTLVGCPPPVKRVAEREVEGLCAPGCLRLFKATGELAPGARASGPPMVGGRAPGGGWSGQFRPLVDGPQRIRQVAERELKGPARNAAPAREKPSSGAARHRFTFQRGPQTNRHPSRSQTAQPCARDSSRSRDPRSGIPPRRRPRWAPLQACRLRSGRRGRG